MSNQHINPNFYQQDFGATTPNVRFDQDARGPQQQQPPPYQPTPPPQPPRPPQPNAPKGGTPAWIWALVAGGALLLLVAVVIVYFIVNYHPGFTMVINGAPPNSDVFVDNLRRGVTSLDGTIKVENLKAGKRIVKITHQGCKDFNTSTTGKDGETKSLPTTLECGDTPKPPVDTDELAAQIEYSGTMMLVGKGEFTMGSDTSNPEEKPAHKVTLPDYYIDKFEVTNAQYKKFCAETKRPLPTNPWWDPQYLNNDSSPVVGVSWDDASAYAKWAGKRLPTEEEWEKAASWDAAGGKKRQWPWGDAQEQGRANLGSQRPTPVGQFANGASAYGVQDMAGNAAEWVNDYYQAYPGNTTAAPEYGTKFRVVRGDSFRGTLEGARTTHRFHFTPQFSAAEKAQKSWLIGFRTVVSADDPKLKQFLASAAGSAK